MCISDGSSDVGSSDLLARAAPRRPEVDDHRHRHRGLDDVLHEGLLAAVFDDVGVGLRRTAKAAATRAANNRFHNVVPFACWMSAPPSHAGLCGRARRVLQHKWRLSRPRARPPDYSSCCWPARSRASARSEAHTSELQSLMRISYAVFCSKKKQT